MFTIVHLGFRNASSGVGQGLAPRRIRAAVVLLLLVSSLLPLAACNDFERHAYRTLKVAKVEYELLQDHAARAYVSGRLTDEQWNRFAVAGHRFIAAHTLAADLMKTYQQARRAGAVAEETQRLQAQINAALAQLPVLLADLRNLLISFDTPAPPASSELVIPLALNPASRDEGSEGLAFSPVASCQSLVAREANNGRNQTHHRHRVDSQGRARL